MKRHTAGEPRGSFVRTAPPIPRPRRARAYRRCSTRFPTPYRNSPHGQCEHRDIRPSPPARPAPFPCHGRQSVLSPRPPAPNRRGNGETGHAADHHRGRGPAGAGRLRRRGARGRGGNAAAPAQGSLASADGRSEVRGDADFSGLPEGIPAYPRIRPGGAIQMGGAEDGAEMRVMAFRTDDPPADVIAFYAEAAARAGFREVRRPDAGPSTSWASSAPMATS